MEQRYKVEQWPPTPKGGMQTHEIKAGVKVTDTQTGKWHACAMFRSQHANRDACIYHLRMQEGAPD